MTLNSASLLSNFNVGLDIQAYAGQLDWVRGEITARVATANPDEYTLTVNVSEVSGTGSFSTWSITNVTGGSWLQYFSTATNSAVVGWDYFEDQSRVASITNYGLAVSGVSRTSILPGVQAIGLAGAAVNDGTSGDDAHGAYIDAVKTNADAGDTFGTEINASTAVVVPSFATPYAEFAKEGSGVLRLGAGS
ncbi:MAG: hypothetical protein K0U93_29520, partial [Gammaproteobacteria bacterium]|nr:hypothetical protein [Gammaproteobacteria bacterium]